jgi:hypothetical protein
VELSDALRTLWPNIEITLNSEVPRRGAFEFVLTKGDGSGMNLETNIQPTPTTSQTVIIIVQFRTDVQGLVVFADVAYRLFS